MTTSSPRAVVAIDSATKSGVALLLPGAVEGGLALYRMAAYGCARRTLPATVGAVLEAVGQAVGDLPVSVYLEEPYLATGRQRNPRTLAALVTCRTYWMVAAEAKGWPVELVRAQTWQTRHLGIRRGAPRDHRKAVAKQHVLRVTGLEVTQDEADAICMACWALRRECVATGLWCRLDERPAAAPDRWRWS